MAKSQLSHARPGDFPESAERVLALTGAQGEGFGVLACTSQRLLFLFVGIVRKQVLEVDWNQAKAAIYNRSTKLLAVYTTRPTKRTVVDWIEAGTNHVDDLVRQ